MAKSVEEAGKVAGQVQLEHVIPAREYYALKMTRGQTLRVIDVEGQQVMDYVAFSLHDPTEKLSVIWTNMFNRSWKITKGHVLYTNRANAMFKIVEDTVRTNYSGGAFCTEQANHFRYGVSGTRNCADNLANAFAPHGIQRKDIDEGSCFNIFMHVAYDPDGTFEIRAPISKAGDYVDLEAQMDALVGMSCCPQERNPCNAFNPTPMKIILYQK
ncbi:MAG: urea carboxylase-associated family protein [Deltaproteobacteria bacterium]|nr:urea carboxylase-associated family protein [Deltaproteobacteria bacterium]MBI3077432.1 urea carboxylase-associated family protein [Deltaproteobacteria bacterium]